MKVYFYIDIYIFLNFIMNVFLLMITALVRQKNCRFFRLFLVSLGFAAVSAGITYFLWGKTGWQFLLAVVQMGSLVFFAFPYENIAAFLFDVLAFFFLTFFSGGCIGVLLRLFTTILMKKKRYALPAILLGVIILFLLFFYFRFALIKLQNRSRTVLSARLVHARKEYRIRVLYDTGNQLVSPYTGEGVAVISEKLAERLQLQEKQNPILIPYDSVGGSGLLKAYRLEKIYLSDGRRKEGFLAAVSENLQEKNEIQMILNIRQ